MSKSISYAGKQFSQRDGLWVDSAGNEASPVLQRTLTKRAKKSDNPKGNQRPKQTSSQSSAQAKTASVSQYRNQIALGIRQPYVEQILRGTKQIEYRTKPTKHRGLVLLYASQTAGQYDGSGFQLGQLPTGVIVGTVEIIDCIHKPRYDDYEWVLSNPKRFDEPLKPLNRPYQSWFYPFRPKK